MRKRYVVGNWKMNTSLAGATALAEGVAGGVTPNDRVEVILCPPFPFLAGIATTLKGSPVALGAQNCYFEKDGAFTGEVSAAMLRDVGCTHVILGHSERRRVLGESSELINKKVLKALELGLKVILCAGETLEEREAGRAEQVVEEQLRVSATGVPHGQTGRVIFAYEPVWAIGTGRNATPQQAQDMHAFTRAKLVDAVGEAKAQELPILYGGSVKPENAQELMSQTDVDGVLVGGASLKADSFLGIWRAALA
jgi:triosephosphate isomerase